MIDLCHLEKVGHRDKEEGGKEGIKIEEER